MANIAHGNDDGSLFISSRVLIPADEVHLRVTTSGGPGGQHANRSLTRVVASFSVVESTAINVADARLILDRAGSVVRTSAGRYRSQSQNRAAALDQLAQKIAILIERPTPRRATRPTKGSKVRRIDDKKARGRVKEQRRNTADD